MITGAELDYVVWVQVNFGAGQENCGCKCTHCTHKFGALDYVDYSEKPG